VGPESKLAWVPFSEPKVDLEVFKVEGEEWREIIYKKLNQSFEYELETLFRVILIECPK
jgi:hypothetical protein